MEANREGGAVNTYKLAHGRQSFFRYDNDVVLRERGEVRMQVDVLDE
jgi:hypothetical protein